MADAVALAKGFKAAQANYSYEYQYDANGNLTFDESKQATISYNHLNLPHKAVNSEGEAKWVYDANGTKLQKIVNTPTGGSSVTYLDGIEEHSGGDVFVYHPEGRYAQYADDPYFPNWRLEYSLRDHLGNNRVMISDLNGDGYIQLSASDWVGNIPYIAPEIIQEEQYYPFGMNMEGSKYAPYWAKKDAYGYNGKELNTDIGLGWMDYGARWYDAAIGRWNGVDLLAEAMPSWSPYNYVQNTPTNATDPFGLSPDFFNANNKNELDWRPPWMRKDENRFPNTDNMGPHYIAQGGPAQEGPIYRPNSPLPEVVVTAKRPETPAGQYVKVGDYYISKKELFGAALQNAYYAKLIHSNGSLELQSEYWEYTRNNSDSYLAVWVPLGVTVGAIVGIEAALAFGPTLVSAAEGSVAEVASGGYKVANTIKNATGGSKQWLRIGNSYSVSGRIQTYGIRWGASPRYAKKIGSATLRALNQQLRKTKLPGKNWRVDDPGHLHIWKK